jgi:hypothetical protein
MLVFAPGANIQVSRTQPAPFVPAFITHEAIGPLELEQILVAGIRIGEPGIELDFGFWEILGNAKISHGGIIGQSAQAYQAQHDGIIVVAINFAQASKTDKQMNNGQQHDQMAAKDWRNPQMRKTLKIENIS